MEEWRRTGKPVAFTSEFVRRDGSRRYADVQGTLADDGDRTLYVLSYQDTTQQRLASRQSKQQEALLRALIDSIPDIIVYKDAHGTYLGCNEAFAALTGHQAANVAGRRANELFPPDSFGFESGLLPGAQSRGIATLPGGVPIVKNGQVVGGIGVFFPGRSGFATEENSVLSTTYNPALPDRSFEAEWIAFAAAGGARAAIGSAPILPVDDLGGVGLPTGFGLDNGRFRLNAGNLEFLDGRLCLRYCSFGLSNGRFGNGDFFRPGICL